MVAFKSVGVFVLLWTFCSGQVQAPEVTTQYGSVSGMTHSLHNGVDVSSYLNIPFAKPPVGDLRFQKPQPPDPWTSTHNGSVLGNACEQGRIGLIWITHPLWDKYSEDCLGVNIYTPADRSGGPYPVMVFLHGGGYQAGANFQYPGYFVASRGVVSVVPNYRLGIFGFVTTSDTVSPGNYGLWDQQLALQFVRDNIAAFGGDPNQVTIYGQSAGAGSAGAMIVSPHAAGLFHQVILQSGSELAIWAVANPDSQPENYTVVVAESLGCPTDTSQNMMDCLRLQDADDLRLAKFNCSEGYLCLGMQPVVDEDFIPDLPLRMRERGEYNRATLMAGWTAEDGGIIAPVLVPEDIDLDYGINRTEYERIVRAVTDTIGIRFPDRAEDVYQAIMWYYTNWPWSDDRTKNLRELVMMVTDLAFASTQDYHLRWHTQEDTTYCYIYGYLSTAVNDSIIPEWMGVPHMLDIPYAFGLPLIQDNPSVRVESMVEDIFEWNQADREWAEYTIDLWTNFAKYGNPTPTPITPPGGSPMQWDEYNHGQYNCFAIDENGGNVLDYRQQEFAFWTQYTTYILNLDVPPQNHPYPPPADALPMAGNAIVNGLNRQFRKWAQIAYPHLNLDKYTDE